MNADHRPDRDAAPTSAGLAATDDLLAHHMRASLGHQALRAAWQLGALIRRAQREAPEVQRPLRIAVEVLLRLGERDAARRAGGHESADRPPAPGPRART